MLRLRVEMDCLSIPKVKVLNQSSYIAVLEEEPHGETSVKNAAENRRNSGHQILEKSNPHYTTVPRLGEGTQSFS